MTRNTDEYEFRSEQYAVKDAELSPPSEFDAHKRPWEFVSMATVPGFPEGFIHGEYPARIVVVWARKKKAEADQ